MNMDRGSHGLSGCTLALVDAMGGIFRIGANASHTILV